MQSLIVGRLEEIREILQSDPGFRHDKESMAAYICLLTVEATIRLIGQSDAIYDFLSVCNDFTQRRSDLESSNGDIDFESA